MIALLDGPAKGQHLALKRAPLFLRVVQDASGKWDALDQIDDIPKPDEKVYAYIREGEAGDVRVCGRGVSGWFKTARYKFCREQPDYNPLHNTEAWQHWCQSWGDKEKP